MAQEPVIPVAGAVRPRQSPATGNRRRARAIALQALYEVDRVRRDPDLALLNRLADSPLPAPAEEFAQVIVSGVVRNRERLDRIISALAPSWPFRQMAIVDRNILRIAVFEIRFGGGTPPKVAINEAVELARSFGSDSSPKFVNGVLGSVMDSEDEQTRP